MATAETAIRPHDRQTKGRRPFAAWVKRFSNFKATHQADKKSALSRTKRKNNNPYPESGFINVPAPSTRPSAPSTFSGRASSFTPGSLNSGRVGSFGSYDEGGGPSVVMRSNKSTAPTLATNPETIHSDTGFSRAGTTYTDGIYGGRANSTFSSPRASQESLATTLTTIQSTAPSALLPAPQPGPPQSFSHQYPVSPPASAVPSHLQPATFAAATAGNLLTDNASILTLASSSKRRRRNSLDTNASVRAIAPSSVWGNSRESLPLSVLSTNMDRDPSTAAATPAFTPTAAIPPGRPSLSGLASAERASVYSNPGVGAPALVSERNSYYSTKANTNNLDAVSVRSGHFGGLGHGRTESINGSITGIERVDRAAATSPLASPREPVSAGDGLGRTSRRASGWKEGGLNVEEEEEDEGSAGESEARDVEEEGKKAKPKDKGKGKENSKGGS